jgi:hypothetical protein
MPDANMKEAGFTAGPLKVWSSLYEGFGAAVVRDVEPLETLAEVRKYRDAVLYAAAPDLYWAMVDLLNDLAPIDYDDEVLEPGSRDAVSAYWMRPTVLAARAALSRAEGRS